MRCPFHVQLLLLLQVPLVCGLGFAVQEESVAQGRKNPSKNNLLSGSRKAAFDGSVRGRRQNQDVTVGRKTRDHITKGSGGERTGKSARINLSALAGRMLQSAASLSSKTATLGERMRHGAATLGEKTAKLGESVATGIIRGSNKLQVATGKFKDEKMTPAVAALSQKLASRLDRGLEERIEKSSEDEHSGDPELNRSMEVVVRRMGYPIERHDVMTQDGYVLGMFRIRHGAHEKEPRRHGRRPPVLLQHGIMDTSAAFVANAADESLGFVLADAGYDVWFGNNRGNVYSRENAAYTITDRAFWNFTWDQMATYDLPAEIEYVLSATGAPQLACVAHSQGATQAFAAFTTNQTLAKKVSVLVALAPCAYLKSTQVPLLKLAGLLGVDKLVNSFGDGAFDLTSTTFRSFGPWACKMLPKGCQAMMDLIAGRSEHINASRIHLYNLQYPAGTSTKNIVQWGHGTRANTFTMFDYDSAVGNQLHYGSYGPPAYPLKDLQVPTALFSGSNDLLADEDDVAHLVRELPKDVLLRSEEIQSYAHLDFAYAQDAGELLYPQVLDVIAQSLH